MKMKHLFNLKKKIIINIIITSSIASITLIYWPFPINFHSVHPVIRVDILEQQQGGHFELQLAH